MSTSQKVAVVTGGSQGIGAGVVAGYRELGYNVVATSRSIGPSEDPGLLTVRGDIADPATAEQVVGLAVERFGRVDALVNNAGVSLVKPFVDYTAADFATVIGTNVAGFFQITQRAIAEMLRQGGGHVVNITATFADRPRSSFTNVLASLTKGGIAAATSALALEHASRGVRVNAVAPGFIATAIFPPETHATVAPMVPLGRMGEVNEIVDAVMYLEQASYVTGEVLHVDGGQIAGQ